LIGTVGTAMAKPGSALVTGASEGIGRALAEVFARHGHDLVLTARNGARLESLAAALGERHGTQVHCLPADLGQPGGARDLFEAVGRLDVEIEILVNNAGFGLYGPFHERELDRHRELIQLNIAALTTLCHLFGSEMVARGRGRILNVASTVAFLPGPLMASYFASKAYVLSLSEGLALELEGQGVGVTCLCPGLTESRFHERAGLLDTSLLRFSQASAGSVAEAGYRGCMAGRAIVLPGFRNRLVPLVERLLPRALLRRIVHAFMIRR
jgi:hypothetical protein